jgi:uncharacterized protein (DUF4415 family)
MKKGRSSSLTAAQRAELKALAARRDGQIDTRSIPEVRDWSAAKRGLFYRPLKQQLTLRIDADVIAWFKNRAREGKRYQTNINHALREYMKRNQKKAG